MYLAHTQFHFWGGGGPLRALTVVVRSSSDPAPLGAVIRREVAALDPALPIGGINTMEEVRGASVSGPRFLLLLIAAFSVAALVVALIGVYGVMAYSVEQRRQEIGVRVALGAAPRAVVGLVLRQGMAPAFIGILGGLVGGLMVTRVLRTLLFQVGPDDPVNAVVVSAIVTLVALIACYLPARRAAAVDPVVALRNN
jgi:putative ABC transport system permease protein